MNKNYYLHDATVRGFRIVGSDLHLDLECGTDDDDVAANISLVFHRIENLSADDTAESEVTMLAEDGELISSDLKAPDGSLIIEWSWYGPPSDKSVVYKFNFSELTETRGPDTIWSAA